MHHVKVTGSPKTSIHPWMDKSLCKDYDPELFFTRRFGAQHWVINHLCGNCPVRQMCFDLGFNDEHGVWGGSTAHQRMRWHNKHIPLDEAYALMLEREVRSKRGREKRVDLSGR